MATTINSAAAAAAAALAAADLNHVEDQPIPPHQDPVEIEDHQLPPPPPPPIQAIPPPYIPPTDLVLMHSPFTSVPNNLGKYVLVVEENPVEMASIEEALKGRLNFPVMTMRDEAYALQLLSLARSYPYQITEVYRCPTCHVEYPTLALLNAHRYHDSSCPLEPRQCPECNTIVPKSVSRHQAKHKHQRTDIKLKALEIRVTRLQQLLQDSMPRPSLIVAGTTTQVLSHPSFNNKLVSVLPQNTVDAATDPRYQHAEERMVLPLDEAKLDRMRAVLEK